MTLFNELRSTIKEMDDAQIQPSSTVVMNILSYSKSLQVVKRQ
jgi:hypothetical protein